MQCAPKPGRISRRRTGNISLTASIEEFAGSRQGAISIVVSLVWSSLPLKSTYPEALDKIIFQDERGTVNNCMRIIWEVVDR